MFRLFPNNYVISTLLLFNSIICAGCDDFVQIFILTLFRCPSWRLTARPVSKLGLLPGDCLEKFVSVSQCKFKIWICITVKIYEIDQLDMASVKCHLSPLKKNAKKIQDSNMCLRFAMQILFHFSVFSCPSSSIPTLEIH